MGSTRAGGVAAGGGTGRGADLVAAAAALRWARPDLTAALADHVLDEASAAGEQERWLAAAGWAVHARAATGDGRDIACDVLVRLGQWDGSALAHPAAHRLRVELAMVAAGAGEVDAARRLVAPVVVADGDPELLADLLCVHARCAVEDAPENVAEAISAAGAAWALVEGAPGELGGASLALVGAVVERRAGRAAVAVDRAAEGLGRLERARATAGTPSGHLGAALAAEWISALLDAGRAEEARDGCGALLPRLSEQARPTRQLALLRLTVARVMAAQDEAADTTQLLEQAAEDAADSDVPDLEAVCRTALGALHEKAERLDTALETLQLAVAAERRDRTRSRRFAAALADLRSDPGAEHAPATTRAEPSDSAATTVLPAITRGDRKLARSRGEELPSAEGRGEPEPTAAPASASWARFERMLEGGSSSDDEPIGEPAAEDAARTWGATPWSGSSTGDSPIGDLLIHNLRSGSAEPADERGPAHRNGRIPGRRAAGEDAEEPTGRRAARRRSGRQPAAEDGEAANGWLPPFDAAPSDERSARRHGARGDAPQDTAASARVPRRRRSREEADATATSPGPGAESPESATARSGEAVRGAPLDATEKRSGRRRAKAERDGEREPGEARAARNGARGRHGRTGEQDHGDTSRRARREARAAQAGAAGESGGTVAREPGRDAGRTRQSDEETAGAARAGAGGGQSADHGDTAAEPSGATAHVNGRRHRADDPWATGRWMMGSAGRRESEAGTAAQHAGEDATPDVTGNDATRDVIGDVTGDVTEDAAIERATPGNTAAEELAAQADVSNGESGSWLQAALADLDRVLGSTSLPTYRDEDPGPADTGCSVVIDIARDGRRFAGRRSGAVVRSVADRLADRLPPGAHQHFGDSDTLLISGSAWSRAEATEWMHRTLPGLLDGFVTEEDLPAAQLRAAVHDADGPVGAQILQNLARPSGRRHESGGNGRVGSAEQEPDLWSDLHGRSSEARGREHGAAGRSARRDRAGAARSGSRSDRDGPEGAGRRSPDDGPPGWPWAGDDLGTADEWDPGADAEAVGGRHGGGRRSAGRSGTEVAGPEGADAEAFGGAGDADHGAAGSRHRPGASQSQGGPTAERPRAGRPGAGRRRRPEGGQDEPPDASSVATGPVGPDSGDTAGSTGAERAAATDTAQATGRNGHRGDAGSATTGIGEARSPGAAGVTSSGATSSGAARAADSASTPGDGAGEPRPGADGEEPAEGLGIADLLAGALAAYRGI